MTGDRAQSDIAVKGARRLDSNGDGGRQFQHAGHGNTLELRPAFFQRSGSAVHQGLGDVGMITGFNNQDVHITLWPASPLARSAIKGRCP